MGVVRSTGTAKFDRIAPGGFEILSVLAAVAAMQHDDILITCGTDSHPTTDPHWRGEAYDTSIEGLDGDGILVRCQRLASLLGPDFTVLYEVKTEDQLLRPTMPAGNPFYFLDPNATGPHIHIQVRIGHTYPPSA